MRIWHIFLIAVTILGLVLVFVGSNMMVVDKDFQEGFNLIVFGLFALVFVSFFGVRNLIRWSKN